MLFIDAKLYMESLLNLFYFGMAIYGCWFWLSYGRDTSGPRVTCWPLRIHAVAIVAIVVLASVNGFLLSQYSDAEFPYVDSLTTFAALALAARALTLRAPTLRRVS